MRLAETYRAPGTLRHWPEAYGISPGVRPRKAHNAAKLKAPPKRVFFIPPLVAVLVQRGLDSGALRWR